MKPAHVRTALTIASAIYLGSIAADAAGLRPIAGLVPQPFRFFTQAACLFPHAAEFAIDYRAEGYRCSDARWIEIDTRPYFPIDADNKENRFQRLMHFFRSDRPTMQALDEWLVGRYDADVAWNRMSEESGPHEFIGGIRVSSLRIAIPHPGDPITRYEHYPLDHYSSDQVKLWYHATEATVRQRCAKYGSLRDEGEPR